MRARIWAGLPGDFGGTWSLGVVGIAQKNPGYLSFPGFLELLKKILLEFDLSSSFFEFFLRGLGVFFLGAFKNRFGSGLDQILGLFKTE